MDTTERIAAALDSIDASDPEPAHQEADALLIEAVPPAVRAAYERVKQRAPWWAVA